MADDANQNFWYFCPNCKERLLFKQGKLIIKHFAHQKQSICSTASEGETRLHLLGKKQLKRFYQEKYSNVKLEVYLRSIKQRPDLIISPGKVIEYQCSPITTKRLCERLDGYKSLDIQSIWILGAKYYRKIMSKKECQQFMRYSRRLGFFMLFWLTDQAKLIVRYRIILKNGHFNYIEKKICKLSQLEKLWDKKISYPNDIINWREALSIQKKLIRRNPVTMNVQSYCYQKQKNIAGCPLMTHFPVLDVPMFNQQILELRCLILIIIEDNNMMTIDNLLKELKKVMLVNDQYCMIKFSLFKMTVNNFLKQLIINGYIEVNNNAITQLKKWRWYSNVDEKMNVIKKIRNCRS